MGRSMEDEAKVLVIPCSGIGKVHGLISRESAYLVTDELATIDGCAKACADKNVEVAGGQVAKAFSVAKALGGHRGIQPGTGSELTDEGWEICREIADAVASTVAQICAGEEVTR